MTPSRAPRPVEAERETRLRITLVEPPAGVPWSRRAKIPLVDITTALVDQATATPGARLEASIAGTAKGGGPACASCKLLAPGWAVVR